MGKTTGNPEWADWVDELAESVGESKSAQTYRRAAKAIRMCPVEYTNPDQAIELSYVGKATVAHIRKKMEEKARRLGLPMPDRASPPKRKAPAKTTAAGPKKRGRKAAEEEEEAAEEALREARRLRTMGLAPGAGPAAPLAFQAHPDGAFNDLPADMEEVEVAENGKGKAKGRAKKEYVPGKGTGNYAILIGLYMHASYAEHSVSTLKTDIIEAAQPYTDTPFDQHTAIRNGQMVTGTKIRHDAWSGMKRLCEEGLVVKEPRVPARFHLLEKGYQLAKQIAEIEGIPKHVPVASSSQGHPSSSGLGRHPSSSGFNGAVSAPFHRPPPSGSTHSAFAGRGQTLGGRPSEIHANVFRRRSATPPLFLDSPGSSPIRRDGGDDDELQFEEDMRLAMDLSRKESVIPESSDPVAAIARAVARGSGSGSASMGEGASSSRPAATTSTTFGGRRAALGQFASSSHAEPAQAPSIANVDKPFGYFYLDEDDRRTKARDEAEVCQDDKNYLCYRIEYRVAQDLHPKVRNLWKVAKLVRKVPIPPDKTRSAFIRGEDSDQLAPGFPESSLVSGNKSATKEKAPDDDPISALLAGFKEPAPRQRKDAMYQPPPGTRRSGAFDPFDPITHSLPLNTTSKHRQSDPIVLDDEEMPVPAPSKRSLSNSSANARPVAGPSTIHKSPPPPLPAPTRRGATSTSASTILASASNRPLARTSTQNPMQACFDPVPGQQIINRHPLDPVRDHVSKTNYTFPRFDPIIWPVGSFKVYLICDTREQSREYGQRKQFCDKLSEQGVNVDRKMLPLGDMLWVARRVDPTTGNPIAGGQEVVLDAIIERKRLDDLRQSIQDGRYLSQKIRLKDSGISHRIYLIENYEDAGDNATFNKAFKTIKSQLQVNDGFFVHEVANVSDTMNYLRKRTQVMAEIYENTEIRIIPDNLIERTSYLALQQHLRATQPSHRYLTTYSTFAELNNTDATLTNRVQWASMVQRIKGMSAEKAVQFLQKWETLAQFYQEAREWEQEIEEENERLGDAPSGRGKPKRRKKEDFVVSNLEDVGPRSIKGALGTKIWEFFMTEQGRYTS